jgi:hypothetical protein
LLAVTDPDHLINNTDQTLPLAYNPDIVIKSVRTEDSRSLIVDYDVQNANLLQPLKIGLYRSSVTPASGTFDPSSAQILGPPIIVPVGNYTTITQAGQDHEVTLDLQAQGGLTPNTKYPYVIADADPANELTNAQYDTRTGSFRTYVISAVVPGFQLTQGLINRYSRILFDYSLTELAKFESLPTESELMDWLFSTWENGLTDALLAAAYDASDAVIQLHWNSGAPDPNAVYDAADELVSQITLAAAIIPGLQANDVIDVRLIAHSRGTVVSSLAMQSLTSSPQMPQLQHGFFKMTLMDPHPANQKYGLNADFSPDFDGLVFLAGYTWFEAQVHDPDVQVPSRVNAVEELYQETPTSLFSGFLSGFPENHINLFGLLPLQIGQDPNQPNMTDLTAPNVGHLEIPEVYAAEATPDFFSTDQSFSVPGSPPLNLTGRPSSASFNIAIDTRSQAVALLSLIDDGNLFVDQTTSVTINLCFAPEVTPDLAGIPPKGVTVNLIARVNDQAAALS